MSGYLLFAFAQIVLIILVVLIVGSMHLANKHQPAGRRANAAKAVAQL